MFMECFEKTILFHQYTVFVWGRLFHPVIINQNWGQETTATSPHTECLWNGLLAVTKVSRDNCFHGNLVTKGKQYII